MAETYDPDNEQARLNPLGQVAALFAQYGQNASNNMQTTFKSMTTQGWIRLVVIVGGYMLLRPYLMKMATKAGVNKLQEQEAQEKAEEKAQISANEFRGVKEKLQEHEDDDDDDAGQSSGNWGQQARVRQRKVIRQLLEAEEKRRQEEEEDKDIQEFLED